MIDAAVSLLLLGSLLILIGFLLGLGHQVRPGDWADAFLLSGYMLAIGGAAIGLLYVAFL